MGHTKLGFGSAFLLLIGVATSPIIGTPAFDNGWVLILSSILTAFGLVGMILYVEETSAMTNLDKITRLRELYAAHLKYWVGRQEIFNGVTVTVFPHPDSEESRKQSAIDGEIEDLLWKLLPDIVAQGLA